MRRAVAAIAALAMLGLVSGCSAQPDPGPTHPTEPPTTGIRLVAPESGVALGDEVRIIVEVTDHGKPVSGQDVTFNVVKGNAAYPGGFESSQTDKLGVATSLGLAAEKPGEVVIRVAAGDRSSDITVDITD